MRRLLCSRCSWSSRRGARSALPALWRGPRRQYTWLAGWAPEGGFTRGRALAWPGLASVCVAGVLRQGGRRPVCWPFAGTRTLPPNLPSVSSSDATVPLPKETRLQATAAAREFDAPRQEGGILCATKTGSQRRLFLSQVPNSVEIQREGWFDDQVRGLEPCDQARGVEPPGRLPQNRPFRRVGIGRLRKPNIFGSSVLSFSWTLSMNRVFRKHTHVEFMTKSQHTRVS